MQRVHNHCQNNTVIFSQPSFLLDYGRQNLQGTKYIFMALSLSSKKTSSRLFIRFAYEQLCLWKIRFKPLSVATSLDEKEARFCRDGLPVLSTGFICPHFLQLEHCSFGSNSLTCGANFKKSTVISSRLYPSVAINSYKLLFYPTFLV